MQYMAWSDAMVCGIASVDAQHRKLLQLINAAYDAVTSEEVHEKLAKLLDDLIEYTVVHFGDEEEIFVLGRYPAIAEHRAQHEELTEKARAYRASFGSTADAMLAAEMLYFLKEWLIQHIEGDDKKACQYLLEHNATPYPPIT